MTDNLVIGILLLTIAAGVVAITVGIVRRGPGSLLPRGEVARVPDRKLMTCGCPLDGRPAYYCMYCPRTSCAEHREEHSHPEDSGPFADADIESTTLAEDFAEWDLECSSPVVRRRVNRLRKMGGRR